MYHKIVQKIKEFDTIIIHRHSRPDGDALGSQIGLKEAIKATFPRKHVYCVGDMVDRYSFMGEMDNVPNSFYQGALVFILDCSEEKMVCDDRYKLAKYIIKIDHHLYKEKFGDLEIVDENEISCASIIARFVFSSGLKLSLAGAEALYTGIVTDSGRFRFNCDFRSTFDICSKLFRFPIDVNNIYNNLYIEELEMVKLRALLISKFKVEGQIAYLINTKEDVESYGVSIFNISRGMVGIMGGIKGIDIWANFTEDSDGSVICELRSSKYNINPVATMFGGGGHKLASGATLESLDKVSDVLAELRKVLEKNNE